MVAPIYLLGLLTPVDEAVQFTQQRMTFPEAQQFVQGYIQAVRLKGDVVLLCDEDAQAKGKYPHVLITDVYGHQHPICGRIILSGGCKSTYIESMRTTPPPRMLLHDYSQKPKLRELIIS